MLSAYVDHYNRARSHRGIGLEVPVVSDKAPPRTGPIERVDVLGGLIHEYRQGLDSGAHTPKPHMAAMLGGPEWRRRSEWLAGDLNQVLSAKTVGVRFPRCLSTLQICQGRRWCITSFFRSPSQSAALPIGTYWRWPSARP